MYSPASSKILYKNPQFLRLAFLQLHHQQQNGVFCDVLLQAEGEAVPAHCCILSACSPFFTERLEQERPAQGQKVVLKLGGLKIKTVRKLVDFLYTSEIEVSQEEAQDVLSAARQLRVSELESLQLEGGKLVKAPQGRRLNRECLLSPISTKVVVPSCHPRAPLSVNRTSCSPGIVTVKSAGKEDKPQENTQQNAENLPQPLLLKRKARGCPTQEKSSPSNHSQGSKDNRNDPNRGPTAVSLPSLYPSVNERLLPRKIKLSRSKLSSDVGTSKPSSNLSGPSSVPTAPGRRLWRQGSIKKEIPEDKLKAGRASPLQSTQSPSGLGKTATSKKRSPEGRAPNSDSAEEGQVGRVKLRKVVNGTCWEVVQEPPLKDSLQSPQIPKHGGNLEEPPSTRPSSVNEPEMASTHTDLSQDSPGCSKLQDILLSASHSPDHPVVKSEFKSSPHIVGQEQGLDIDCREPYAFDMALLGQPCEAEYQITSTAATSQLEEILDFMFCGSDGETPAGSLECPGVEGCRTPSYHLTETGKTWIEGEEWCLPDIELWPKELTGLEKESVDENKGPVEPLTLLTIDSENKEPINSLSPLVIPSEVSEGEVLSVRDSWTPDLELTSSQPLDSQTHKLPTESLGPPQRTYEDLPHSCSKWMETGLDMSLTTDEVLPPAPVVTGNFEPLGPLPVSSEEEEIDVEDWTSVPISVPSVWPDPSSESDTEVDILT